MERIQIKSLPGYENVKDYYYVQKDGQVWSEYSKKYLAQCKHYNSPTLRDEWKKGLLDKEPYYIIFVGLHKDNTNSVSTYPLHRIVATAFIPNPNNLPEVNHIDKNTSNNCYTNLEWIEKEKNIKLGLSKTVWQCDKQTHQRIQKFNSFADAARAIGVNGCQNIIANCKGRRKSAYGYFWEYDDDFKN